MVTMSKQIKISDELYDFLKKEAAKGYRPMGKQLEFLLDTDKVSRVVMTKVKVKPLPSERFPDAKGITITEKPKFMPTKDLCKIHGLPKDQCKLMKGH